MSGSDLLRSNPVFAIEAEVGRLEGGMVAWVASAGILDPTVGRLCARGQRLPGVRVRRWASHGLLAPRLAMTTAGVPDHRAVGLVVEPGGEDGFVVPLDVRVQTAWQIAPQLPVSADRLLDLLARVVEEIEPDSGAGLLPERFAFRVDSPFPRPSLGRSMDVAVLIAVLLASASAAVPGAARAIVALVEPDGDRLAPVDGVEVKLRAFEREIAEGGILIRHPDCPSAGRWDAAFGEVWTVDTFGDLARQMLRAGWLEGVLAAVPLEAGSLPRVDARLERLLRGHDHHAVLGLTRRMLDADRGPSVPRTAVLRALRARLTSLRHLGRSTEAMSLADRLRADTAALGHAVSHDDLAQADLEFAASRFDPGWFDELLTVLEPWRRRTADDPLLLPPTTRVRIWNTIARARIAAGHDGWEELLDASLRLQRDIEPSNCVRTANYRIEGLLRAGRLEEAERAIDANLAAVASDDRYSARMLAVYRADLARRAGRQWEEPGLDGGPVGSDGEDLPRHLLGLYELAVARQRGRSAVDVAARLERAAHAFVVDRPHGGDVGPLHLLELVARLGAAEARDDRAGRDAALAALCAQRFDGPIGARVAELAAAPDAGGPRLAALCGALPWC